MSPSRSRSPKRKAVGAGSDERVEAAVAARRAELTQARESSVGLLVRPVRTLSLFGRALSEFALTTLAQLVVSRPVVYVGFPLFLGWLITHLAFPALYAPPTCIAGSGSATAAAGGGPLYLPALYVYEFGWWLVLGILSSIGFGSGLHSGIMFLWPFVMRVVAEVEVHQSTRFNNVYNHPCLFEPYGTHGDGTDTFFNKLVLVWPAVIVWGAGTAIGELPPYFVTRAAKRAGTRSGEFETELAEAKNKTDLVSRIKVATIDFTRRNGFLGIFLLASWPNAAFDMCGMACGWLEMPFWTFFGATLLGKSLAKTTLQSAVCIWLFSPVTFAKVAAGIAAAESALPPALRVGFGAKAAAARRAIMRTFELQNRMTLSEFLGGAKMVSEESLVQKYCAVASQCGAAKGGGRYSDPDAVAAVRAVVRRVLDEYDADGNGKLSQAELQPALSSTDGRLSLGALDPGAGGLFSPANLWNGFIACLCLFFVLTIVDQIAAVRQADLDEAELAIFEAEVRDGPAEKKML